MASLRVISSTQPPVPPFPLGTVPTQIGRESGCELRLADETVSRRHARVIWSAEGGYEIIDDDSRGGVWINGERISRCRLVHGDQVTIGTTMFQFDDPDELGATQAVPVSQAVPVAAPPPAQGVYVPPPPGPVAPVAPSRAGGCAISCLVGSIVLFLATIGGSLFALYRAGYLTW